MTLLEVLISLAVLIVFVVPAVTGLSQALAASNQSSTSAAASSIARETLENLKLLGYSAVQSSAQPSFADLRPGDHFFQVTTRVTEIEPNDASLKGLKQVEVSVCQTGSQTPLVVLTTYFTPVGV